MALMKLLEEDNPWGRMRQLQREMERLWPSNWLDSWPGIETHVYPQMNIYDDGESFIVRAEVPGVDPKQIDVSATNDTITIRGKREMIQAEKDSCYHRQERSWGEFRRVFRLPDQVDSNKVVAICKNGILEIRLPRAEYAKMRKIEVTS